MAPPYTEPDLALYSYWGGITGNTFGVASENPPGWSQGPSPAVFVGLENDHMLTAADLADLPSYVNPASLPPIGSLIDLIGIGVNEYMGTGSQGDEYILLDIGFAFDPADDVLTGLTMGDMDFTKLFTHAIYTVLYAEYYIDDGSEDGITRWEAIGPLAASPVPVPAAVWLFGSGLLGLLGISRRRAS